MASRLENYVNWDTRVQHWRIRHLPQSIALKGLSLDNIKELKDIIEGDQVIFDASALRDLPRFWQSLAEEAIRRLSKED